MNQISKFSQLDSPSEIAPPQIKGMFAKYFEVPFYSQSRYKSKYFIKQLFKNLIIYNSVMYFGIWLVCFVLLKLQTRNKLTLLSSQVFAGEYLVEKVTSVIFYILLVVYLGFEIAQQASRKIFFIDWEHPNLEKIREKRIRPNKKMNPTSYESKTLEGGNPQSKLEVTPFPCLTQESDPLNSKVEETPTLFGDSFEEAPDFPELDDSEEEAKQEPIVKNNFEEDLVKVREKDHPINLMNMVYQNYFQSNDVSLNYLNSESTVEFPLFVSKTSESSSDAPAQLTKTSAWRKIMITNSFNEVSVQLKISPLLILSISYCILEGLGSLDLGYLTRKGQSIDQFTESHYFLRKYWIFGVVLVVSVLCWVVRLLFKFVHGFACSELLDLCSVCNISLLVQLECGSFCYVHGKNHSGSGEGDLQTIYSKLVLEGAELKGTRGLEPQSDHQVFEVLAGSALFRNVEEIQTQAGKYLEFLQSHSFSNRALSEPVGQSEKLRNLDLRIFELLNGEVESVLKDSLKIGRAHV